MEMITSIQISTTTRERLQQYGRKEETYDELINRILNEVHAHEWIIREGN